MQDTETIRDRALAGVARWFPLESIPTGSQQLRAFTKTQLNRIYRQLLTDHGEPYKSEEVGRVIVRGHLATPRDRWKKSNPGRIPPVRPPEALKIELNGRLLPVFPAPNNPLYDPEPSGDVFLPLDGGDEEPATAERLVYWPKDPQQALHIFLDYLAPAFFLGALQLEYMRRGGSFWEPHARKVIGEITQREKDSRQLDPDEATRARRVSEAVALWRFENGYFNRIPLLLQSEGDGPYITAFVESYLLKPYLSRTFDVPLEDTAGQPILSEEVEQTPANSSFVGKNRQRKKHPSTTANDKRRNELVKNFINVERMNRTDAIKAAAKKEGCSVDTIERAVGLRK